MTAENDGKATAERSPRNPAPDDELREDGPLGQPADRPQTMQDDHEDVVGRQRYPNARPGDTSKGFQDDGSGSHPVKPADGDGVDEDGIPDIASRKPHENKLASD